MKYSDITFVHGWGCGPDIWNELVNHLPEFTHQAINLGFTGTETDLNSLSPKPSIYVTHSLGTMWALRNRHAHMATLISINGFTSFYNFTPPRTLKTMKINLKRNPELQMEDFWKTTKLPTSASLNIPTLKTGLDWLIDWDCEDQLAGLTCPVTSAFSRHDPILDFDQMKKQWKDHNISIFEDGGHALPMTHPHHLATMIRDISNAL
ncbi:MAG: alpha/beta fold hydrolase [Alphaproteobacteria bacterium]